MLCKKGFIAPLIQSRKNLQLQVVTKTMKINSIILIVTMLTMTMLCVSAANPASAMSEDAVSPGPAPNSGDGVPDGSGFEPTTFPVEMAIGIPMILGGVVVIFVLFKRR